MKVYYHADTDKRKFEGRTTLARKLKEFLGEKGIEFVSHPRDADLLHFHSSGIIDTYKAAAMKKEYKIPCVYTFYSVGHTEPWGHIKNRLLQRVYLHKTATNALLSYSAITPLRWRAPRIKELDAFITLTNYVKKRSFSNTIILRAGVDVKHFTPIKRRRRGTVMKVAFMGHPTVQKGLIDFVQASRYFPKNCIPYVFPTKMTKKIACYCKKKNPKIVIGGLVKDIKEVYQEMDIIVLPYRSKISSIANPLVLLEAMACGKAVVTTNFSFIKEIVRDAALVVKPASPKLLAKAVSKLRNPELRQIVEKKARQRILDEFTEEKMFHQYLSIYASLVK